MATVHFDAPISEAALGSIGAGPASDATLHEVPAKTPILGQKADARRKAIGRMGPWRLVRLVGQGATTRVYRARPADAAGDAAPYAVKALRREWWSDPAAVACQRREAWVGQRVSHPNLAPVLAAHVAAPPFYVVTPYLAGESAAAMLASGRRPSLPTALWIARQAAEALAALARAGWAHGDVKPANLMVGPDGHTTLLDLGFCQSPAEARSWATRPVVGTLRYLAPERFTSSMIADERADLYSLGVTLYELLTGIAPFDAESPGELLRLHREAKPRCLRDARPGCPKPVASLVHRLLAKDPMRRPATADEVARELAPLEIACFALR